MDTTGLYRPIFRPSNQRESIGTDVKITKPNTIALLYPFLDPVSDGKQQSKAEKQKNNAAVIGSVVTVLLVAALVVAVIVLIRYSDDSPTGSSAGSGCYCPHQVQ